MSKFHYERIGRLIYGAHRAGGNETDIQNWMANDLGVVLTAGDDRAAHDLYSAYSEKYAADDAFQENFSRFLESLANRG